MDQEENNAPARKLRLAKETLQRLDRVDTQFQRMTDSCWLPGASCNIHCSMTCPV
jgi:hypothetical protein